MVNDVVLDQVCQSGLLRIGLLSVFPTRELCTGFCRP